MTIYRQLMICAAASLPFCVLYGASQDAVRRDSQASKKLMDAPIGDFVASGTTPDVVRSLARSMRVSSDGAPEEPSGVIGFENIDKLSGARLTITAVRSDVRSVLQSIIAQNAGYHTVETEYPVVMNILAVGGDSPGHDILDYELSHLDIEVDIESDELITHLFNFSPELREYLVRRFNNSDGTAVEASANAKAGILSTIKPPHFTIHLQHVTVRQALNAIAAQSFQIWKQYGWNIPTYLPDGTVVVNKDAPHITPTGWEFHFVDPRGMSFDAWTREMFRSLL